jgi:pyruvate dehydrogenase (quinone)
MNRVGATSLVVVFNDNTLASIKRKQELAKYADIGVHTSKADFAALAESLGLAGYRASSQSEVARAVEQWRASGAPALLEIEVDYSHYRRMGY